MGRYTESQLRLFSLASEAMVESNLRMAEDEARNPRRKRTRRIAPLSMLKKLGKEGYERYLKGEPDATG